MVVLIIQVLTREQLADAIERNGDAVSAAYIRTCLDGQIKKCMMDIMRVGCCLSLIRKLCLVAMCFSLIFVQAAKDSFIRKRGYFDLLGLDFMITPAPNNKLVLLEANTNPALCVGMPDVITQVIDGTMELVLTAHNKKGGDTSIVSQIPEGFSLVFDEAEGFEYTEP